MCYCSFTSPLGFMKYTCSTFFGSTIVCICLMDPTCYSELFKMVGKRTKCILLKFIFMSLTLFLFKDYLMSNVIKNILKSFEKQVPKKIPQRKSKRAKELEAKFPVDIFVNKSRKLDVSTRKKFLNRWKYRRDAHRNRVHHIKNKTLQNGPGEMGVPVRYLLPLVRTYLIRWW